MKRTRQNSSGRPKKKKKEIRDPMEEYLALHALRKQLLLDVQLLNPETNDVFEGAPPELWNLAMTHLTALPRSMFAWGVPTKDAIDLIVAMSPHGVVEVGAGTGLWSFLLQKSGTDSIAFDKHPLRSDTVDSVREMGSGEAFHHTIIQTSQFTFSGAFPCFTRVHKGGPEQASFFPERTLLLCWPPPSNTMAEEALANFRGNTVAYIGEFPGSSKHGKVGQNGTKRFHRNLRSQFNQVKVVALPQMPLCSDTLTIWKRKRDASTTESGEREDTGHMHEDGPECRTLCSEEMDEGDAWAVRLRCLRQEEEAFSNAFDEVMQELSSSDHSE